MQNSSPSDISFEEMQIKMGKPNQQITNTHFFLIWVAALLINTELNCCRFSLTGVIRATEVQCA